MFTFYSVSPALMRNLFLVHLVLFKADGHMDSLGSSAQFCTYTIMENETKEILSIVNIDKGETQRSSVMMEREGFIRSFDQIHQEVKLTEVCTDSQSQISALFGKSRPQPAMFFTRFEHCHGATDFERLDCFVKNRTAQTTE